MNTYYTIRLSPAQRNALLLAAEYASEEIDVEPFNFSDEELKLLEPMKTAHELLKNAPQHPNAEDVYEYEAKHTGHKAGDKVLVEGVIKRDMRDGNYHVTFSRDVSVMWTDSDRFDGLDVPEYYVNPAE